MALKSSNKVDTNRYQLEVEIDGETFEKRWIRHTISRTRKL